MADKIQDGGPAFPMEGEGMGAPYYTPGMSLRDWFAGQAMAGLLVSFGDWTADRLANSAYEQADAMLRAREGK